MKKLISLLLIAGLFAACTNKNNMNESNASGENAARMQQFYDEVINAHNVAMADSFLMADAVDHNPGPGHTGKGLDEIKADLNDLFTEYPDVHVKVNNVISRGDTIFSFVTMTGTNTGSTPNMPATNKSFNIDGVDIVKVQNGKATDRWGYFEEMKMMQQLGMMPEGNMGASMADQNPK